MLLGACREGISDVIKLFRSVGSLGSCPTQTFQTSFLMFLKGYCRPQLSNGVGRFQPSDLVGSKSVQDHGNRLSRPSSYDKVPPSNRFLDGNMGELGQWGVTFGCF